MSEDGRKLVEFCDKVMGCLKPESKNEELSALAKRLPGHLVDCKRLWLGDVSVEIEHIDNDPFKPLNYVKAFKRMVAITES